MCIVIDINAISNVFNSRDERHSEFIPVLNWILYGRGKIVFGGETYRQELKNSKSYLPLIVELGRARKTVPVSEDQVNDYESRTIELVKDKNCDDAHLIAIIAVSGCRLICSNDCASHKYVKNKKLYPKRCRVPSFYTNTSNSDLLTDNNITKICEPCVTLNKKQIQQIEKFL
jgi:hypothetical protein